MSEPRHLPELQPILAEYRTWAGGLIPALHAVQHEFGFIDPAHIPALADAFNLSVAEVHGVISFYTDFRTTPPAGPAVQVCRAEACASRGGGALLDAARKAAVGRPVEVQEVFCLGLCAQGPAVAAGGELHVGVTESTVGRIVADAAEGTAVSVSGRADTSPVTAPDAPVVHVPRDAAARAAGADAVAAAFEHAGARVVRTGSRGMLWLEPLVEVDGADGRAGFANVQPADVAAVLTGDSPTAVGLVEQLPWMARQQRITFGRVGVVDPRDAGHHEAHGGLVGLRRALAMSPSEVVEEVTRSGLRGRGGAAFPTGIKLRTVLDTPSDRKYVVCNADEGDSGTFADRMLMEGDPFLLVEGMVLAGWAVGANDGYVYIRSEYPDAITAMRSAIAEAEAQGWLTAAGSQQGVLGTDFVFRLHVRVGAGAYICGEETALMESIEGRRGIVRAKPPLPAVEGLWGRPTVINNVLSIAALPSILADGAEAYAALGTGRSRGTQVVQLAGNVARGGIVEVPFGITVGELVHEWGGGTASGRPVRTVQVGGPLGAYLSLDQFDLPIDYEAFNAAGALLGHGSVVVFDDTVDMAAMARFAMEFCAAESCGKCTPCRIGSTRGVELIDRITAGIDRDRNLATLVDLCEVMADASLCAMGGFTPLPVRSALTHFADDFQRPAHHANGAPR